MPAVMAQALRADCLGSWMPLAMADLCAIMAGFCGDKVESRDFIKAWGLYTKRDESEQREEDLKLLENIWFGKSGLNTVPKKQEKISE